jgi:ribosomal protein S18 acetylase RimI-like enzyme
VTAARVIREINVDPFERVWPILETVIAGGDTFVYRPDQTVDDVRHGWAGPPSRCFIAERNGAIAGCYDIKPNQPGLGDHVANAGYAVAADARGQGVASAMCEHSMQQARRAGFTAMQFNFVVATNTTAVRLWQRHGFQIVGQVPGAFRHAKHGLTDVYIKHRTL